MKKNQRRYLKKITNAERVFAVILKEKRVFLVQEKKKHMQARWSFPGGKIDEGETGEEALVREVKEETGMEAEIVRALGLDVSKKTFFLVQTKGEVMKFPTKEILSVGWFSWKEIKNLKKENLRGKFMLRVF